MRAALAAVVVVLPVLLGASPPRASQRHVVVAVSTSDQLSRRLCDALQGVPASRKAQCCGTSPSAGLASACTREVDRALREHAITLAAADVDRCAADTARALDGCTWVTPWMPETPSSCRGIVRGRRDAGASCRSSLECADGLFCRGAGPATSGVCTPPGRPGANCSGIPDALATYARETDGDTRHPECAGYCLRGRCTAPVALGGECSSSRQCAAGTQCASGRCVAGVPQTLVAPAHGAAGAMKCSAWPPAGSAIGAREPVASHPIPPSAP